MHQHTCLVHVPCLHCFQFFPPASLPSLVFKAALIFLTAPGRYSADLYCCLPWAVIVALNERCILAGKGACKPPLPAALRAEEQQQAEQARRRPAPDAANGPTRCLSTPAWPAPAWQPMHSFARQGLLWLPHNEILLCRESCALVKSGGHPCRLSPAAAGRRRMWQRIHAARAPAVCMNSIAEFA